MSALSAWRVDQIQNCDQIFSTTNMTIVLREAPPHSTSHCWGVLTVSEVQLEINLWRCVNNFPTDSISTIQIGEDEQSPVPLPLPDIMQNFSTGSGTTLERGRVNNSDRHDPASNGQHGDHPTSISAPSKTPHQHPYPFSIYGFQWTSSEPSTYAISRPILRSHSQDNGDRSILSTSVEDGRGNPGGKGPLRMVETNKDEQSCPRPSKRQRYAPSTSSTLENGLLACPYAKFDPFKFSDKNVHEKKFRGCRTFLLSSIPRLK